MLKRHRWLPLTILALFVGCQDATGPQSRTPVASGIQADFGAWVGDPTHLLRQAVGAPPLETYQVSFWARHDRLTQVTINYTDGQPFLWFDIPKDALKQRGDGSEFKGKDSVLITLTIDSTTFLVDLDPSVKFKHDKPASLVFWFEYADPDLNADGVVDGTDAALREQLHVVTRPVKRANWHPAKSAKGQTLPYVYAYLQHFSQWAVSW